MKPLDIGIDIDEPLSPWYEAAHEYCKWYLFPPPWPELPKTWHPWEEYGCTHGEWTEAITNMVEDRWYAEQPPVKGSISALLDLRAAGHRIHLITARGGLPRGDEIKAQTREWVAEYFPFRNSLIFNKDKTCGGLHWSDVFIDDRLPNLDALAKVGTKTYVLDRTWNKYPPSSIYSPYHYRVDSIREFADIILHKEAA